MPRKPPPKTRPATRATGTAKGHLPAAKSKPANKKRSGWQPPPDHAIKPEGAVTSFAEAGDTAPRNDAPVSASVTIEPGKQGMPRGRLKIDLMNVPAEVAATEDLDTANGRQKAIASGPPSLQRAVRRVEAFNLRVAGYDYRQIHQALNEAGYSCSLKTIYYDVQETLRELSQFERVLAEDVRAMQLARLDQLMAGLSDTAFAGDTYAVEAYLRVLEHQAKLLGIFAPTEININQRRPLHNATEEELAKLMQRMAGTAPLPMRVLHSLGPVAEPPSAEGGLPDITVRNEAEEVDPPEPEPRDDEVEAEEPTP